MTVFNLDQGSGVDVKCDEGVISPDIATDLNGDKRFLYCDGKRSIRREGSQRAVKEARLAGQS